MSDSVLLAWALSPLGPLMNFFNPEARLYHAYIAGGLIVAFVWYWRAGRLADYGPTIFSRKVWLSQSAVNDYFVMLLNPWFLFPIIFLSEAHVRAVFLRLPAFLSSLGLAETSDGNRFSLLTGAALTICLFIADDFSRWAMHYISHRVPVLWEFHKVHHSAEVLNFVTAERSHPLDVYITTIALVASAALVNGVFIALFGSHLTVSTIAGANIITVAFNFGGAVLRHSPFWISYGSTTERWLISPAMHHIHHSSLPTHWDRNFGSFLSIWDRVAGTLYIPRSQEAITFGIGNETISYRRITNLYALPFKKVFRSKSTHQPT